MARETIATIWANNNPGGVTEPAQSRQDDGYGAVKPPYQEHNWLFQLFTDMLQNAEQRGFMEWKTETEYQQNGKCTGSDGIVYNAVIANDGNDPIADDGTNWLPWLQTEENPFINYAMFRDEKSSGTDGGSFAVASWETRDLADNGAIGPGSAINNINGCSISSNQITLPAGKYRIKANAPGYSIGSHKLKIRNISDGADLIIGTNSDIQSDLTTGTIALLNGEFEITATKVLELQHRTDVGQTTNGFGIACGFGVVEVYSEAEIWKILN